MAKTDKPRYPRNVRPHGEGWQVQVRKKGFPSQTRTFDKMADAIAWEQTTQSSMTSGLWQDSKKARETPFPDLLLRYELEEAPKKRSRISQEYLLQGLREVKRFQKPVSAISSEDIAAFRNERVKAGYAASTIRTQLSILSKVFKVAKTEWGYNSLGNPAAADSVSRPELPPGASRTRTGTEKEVEEVLQNSESLFLRPFVLLLLETAARRSDLCRLRWEQVNLGSDTPSAHFLDTKNKEPRKIPLSPKAVKIIESLPGPRKGPVFKQKDWHPTAEDDGSVAPALRADSVTQAWIRARERAGEKNPEVLDLRLHDHRHTAITRLVEETSLKNVEVAAISGHKDSRQLQRYYNSRAEKLSEKLGWNRSAEVAEGTPSTEGPKIVIRKQADGQWSASLGDIEIIAPTAKEARETLKDLAAE